MMQKHDTAHSTCAPENHPTLPVPAKPETPPKPITKTITNRRNEHGFPIGRLATIAAVLAAFGALVYFVPMAALAVTCSVGLYLTNTFVDGQFTRGRRHGK